MNITTSMDEAAKKAIQDLCLKVMKHIQGQPNQEATLESINHACKDTNPVEALMVLLDRGDIDEAVSEMNTRRAKVYVVTPKGRDVIKRGRILIRAAPRLPDEGDPNPGETVAQHAVRDLIGVDQAPGEEGAGRPPRAPTKPAKPAPARTATSPSKGRAPLQKPTPAKEGGKGVFPPRAGKSPLTSEAAPEGSPE